MMVLIMTDLMITTQMIMTMVKQMKKMMMMMMLLFMMMLLMVMITVMIMISMLMWIDQPLPSTPSSLARKDNCHQSFFGSSLAGLNRWEQGCDLFLRWAEPLGARLRPAPTPWVPVSVVRSAFTTPWSSMMTMMMMTMMKSMSYKRILSTTSPLS